MTSSIKFGLIGYGAWGGCHAGAIATTPDAELVAISAQSAASCDRARTDYPGADVYQDYRDLIRRDDIDVVDIVLPSHLHHEVAAAVLKAGKHLLLEKPMCLSITDCDDLIRLAKENNCLLNVGHELRLSSLWGTAKELVAKGYIGTPQYALVELSRNPYRTGADGWRYDIERVGSWILEEPIHFFDMARWFLEGSGTPSSIYATGNNRNPEHPELQDNFSAIMKFDSGAYAVVTQTLSAFEHHQTVKVTGSKGALWASWSGAMDRTREPSFSLRAFDGEKVETIPITKVTGELFELEDQIAMMVRAVQYGEPLTCTGEDGRWSVAMCLAAQKSIETKSEIDMREFAN
ncbi:MAG: dehydrogenase [Planctomyces sp.]|nr:dehydrogenase [Planctomyces sp.]